MTFSFVPADGQTAVSPASQSVAPGQTLALADALVNLWSLTGRTGAVTISFDQAVAITAHKYAD